MFVVQQLTADQWRLTTEQIEMGLKHKAKKGTVIEANGVTITVLQGSPQLEISAPPEVRIKTHHGDVGKAKRSRGRSGYPRRK